MSSVKKEDGQVYLRWLKEEGVKEFLPEAMPDKVISVVQPKTSDDLMPAGIDPAFEALRSKVLKCTLCRELASTRKSVVFGAGNPHAALMFVGEAPGYDEDVQGLPFVGRAGQLLTKIIESIGLSRDEVFIANVLKCRPPQNRPPQPDEIDHCRPYLEKQIEMIRPKIICALGKFSAQTLLKTDQPISKLRGRFMDYPVPLPRRQAGLPSHLRIQVMSTYHPAYLLRNPAEKRTVWEDMKKIRKELDALAQNPSPA